MRLAERADARLTVLVADGAARVCGVETRRLVGTLDEAVAREAERDPVDLVIVVAAARATPARRLAGDARERAPRARRARRLRSRSSAPSSASAGGEQGKVDILFAGRLLRHIGAEVTVLMVVPGDEPDPVADAAGRALRRGRSEDPRVRRESRPRTAVRHGDAGDCIEEEATAAPTG